VKVTFDLPVEKAKAFAYVCKYNKVRDDDFLRLAVDKAIDEALDANAPGVIQGAIDTDKAELAREAKGDIRFLEADGSRGWFDWSGPTIDLRPVMVETVSRKVRGHFEQKFVADEVVAD